MNKKPKKSNQDKNVQEIRISIMIFEQQLVSTKVYLYLEDLAVTYSPIT
jgi:hypothetical protein